MKIYKDVKHITSDIPKIFEKNLNIAVSVYQSQGYSVEIQHAFNGRLFSAIVLAYKEE